MPGVLIEIVDRSAIVALDRVGAGIPAAIERGLRRFGLLVGRAIAERAPKLSGRLARSFLIPDVAGDTVLLGHGVPIYGAIHEYGGDIVPKNAPYLVFQVGGRWVRTKHVHIREKKYASGGLAATAEMGPTIIGAEILRTFVA